MTSSAFIRVLLMGMLSAVSCNAIADNSAVSTPMNSANSTTEKSGMSLLDAYHLALKNDASLAAAQATYKASAEVVPQARSALLPQLGASANTTYNKNDVLDPPAGYGSGESHWNSHGWSATLSQSVFDLSKWFNLSAAHAKDQVAKLTLAITEQQLIYDVADKYFSVLRTQDDKASAQAHLRAVKKQLDQTQERFKVGMVANTDVQEAKAAYDTARVALIQANNAITVAKENLFLLTNTPTPELSKLNQKMPVVGPEPALASVWVKQAMTQNLKVKQSNGNVNSNQKELSRARSGHLPTLSGTLTYQHSVSNNASAVLSNGGKTNGMVAALSVSIPIFSGGMVSSQASAAGYTLEASQKNEDQTVRQAKADTLNSFNTVNADVLQVGAWCQSIVSAASALKATLSGYEVGTRTIIDVLNSQDKLYNAQKQYLDSRYNFILNTLKLKLAAGTLSPRDLNVLSQWIAPADTLPKSLTPYCKAD